MCLMLKTNSNFTLVFAFLLGIGLGYFWFGNADSNSTLEYGDTGLPKNCRAIIKDNYEGWNLGNYSPEEALDSINRNCGEFGYSW